MPERPDALALLEAARESLGSELLPGASAEQKLPMLMLAKALSIAVRELAKGEADPDGLELAALHSALGSVADDVDAAGLREHARERLRAGHLDTAADARLRTGLLATTRARLAISNPRLLSALDGLYQKDAASAVANGEPR